MGIQEELAEAIAIVNGLPSIRRGGAFVADVERFVAYLGAMPDNQVSDITESVVASVRREADRLVDCIERRVDLGIAEHCGGVDRDSQAMLFGTGTSKRGRRSVSRTR